MLKKLLITLEDYLLPQKCCVCLKIGTPLCPSCRVKIKKVNNFCHICGEKSQLGLICKKHKKEKAKYQACFLLTYSEDYIIKKALSIFKLKRNQGAGIILGKLLGKNMLSVWHKRPKEWLNLETIIIPLPISKFSQNKISFNPSEVLARGVSKTMDIKILNKKLILKKIFFQKEAKFSWQGEGLKGNFIIVVSEVMPPSKELEEVARILKNAGAEIIIFSSIIN